MVIKNVSTLKKVDRPRNFPSTHFKIYLPLKNTHGFFSDDLKMSINSDHVIVLCFIMTDMALASLILQDSWSKSFLITTYYPLNIVINYLQMFT